MCSQVIYTNIQDKTVKFHIHVFNFQSWSRNVQKSGDVLHFGHFWTYLFQFGSKKGSDWFFCATLYLHFVCLFIYKPCESIVVPDCLEKYEVSDTSSSTNRIETTKIECANLCTFPSKVSSQSLRDFLY